MSELTPDASTPEAAPDDLDTVIVPRTRDLGGFEVRRALPHKSRQMVGPFIFVDQMGPSVLTPGTGIDVRPHPHIGLSTVTYLFDGIIRHKDSLGVVQDITPGDLNYMTAGRGITHSERTPDAPRAQGSGLYGFQTWMALPKAIEEGAPDFVHAPKGQLPVLTAPGVSAKIILGHAFGSASPVATPMDTLYVDVELAAGAAIPLPKDHEDRAAYLVSGSLDLSGHTVSAGELLIFREGKNVTLRAGAEGARLMLLGGEVADGPRHIWWNFVASDPDMIEAAKAEWKAADWGKGRFDLPATDRDEWIPID